MTMTKGNVQVWILDLDRDARLVERYRAVLSDDELERAARLRSFELQADFIYTRGVLRHILTDFAAGDFDPAELQFTYEDRGKPHLIDEQGGDRIGFNVSHSRDVSVFAVANQRSVGVDVEFVRGDYEHRIIAERWFSELENELLTELDEGDRLAGFFATWARKEALVKALGTGISHRLSSFSVSVDPKSRAEILETYWEPTAKYEWDMRDLPLPPDYAGAVVARGKDWTPVFQQWNHKHQ